MRGMPLVHWKQRKRRDLPLITPRMFAVLVALKAAKDADYPFIHLDGVDGRTIRALCDSSNEHSRGWAFESQGLDGVRYTITGAGERALKVYAPRLKRGDGICPRCGERPRRIRKRGAKAGTPAAYCVACESRMAKRKLELGIQHRRPGQLCPRCHKRTRYVSPSGRIGSYCPHCKKILHNRAHRKERRLLLKRIQAGEHIPCRRAGCDEPRRVSGKTVQDYCYRHFRAYMNAYNDRRRPDSPASSRRNQKGAPGEDAPFNF